MGWTDSHCHVASLDALTAAAAAGVDRVVVVGTDVPSSGAVLADVSAARAAGLAAWATAGVHPHDASDGVTGLVAAATASPAVVAVGECGLDYHYAHSPRSVQREVFAAQVALASTLNMALIVHTRDAWDDTFAVLDAIGVPERTVIHCFTGGVEEARGCLDRGAYLSFSGIVTFKNAADVREAAALCPLDRLLVETDAPYLAPVPHRGKTNTPAFVPLVGAVVATVKGVDPEVVEEATWTNAGTFFGLADETAAA